MDKEKIFLSLPHFFKNIAVSLLGNKNKRQRKKGNYNSYLNLFKDSASWPKNKLENYQKEELAKLLLEVFEFSQYYQKILINLKVSKEDIINAPFKVLNKMPFLEKETLKNDLELLVNTIPNRAKDLVNFTSGTTGTPTITYYDNDSIQKSFALLNRYYNLSGLKEGFKGLRLSGRIIVKPNKVKPPFWVFNSSENQLFVSTYHLNEINLKPIVEKINKFKPELIEGYPSAIYIISKYINANNIKLSFIPKCISTTAETLYDYQKEEIFRAFKTTALNQYSSSEGGVFITECKNGKLHLNLESGIFEFYNLKGENAKPGEMAELVSTSFRNSKTPLVRYKTGDWVKLPENLSEVCSCGMNSSFVEKIIGREDDILFTEEKGYVGRMDTAYKGLVGISKSQIIQESPNLIIVNQVIDEDYTKEMDVKFIKNLRDRLGTTVNIKINNVENIPLGANGKFNAVIRKFELPIE
ncbi:MULTISPECIES: acyl-CoA synthetase family protein [Tenacibaculum]|uniref:hypothetical protein n=1 Tax=Tenacibaculum TaxID=104267 RepID=UPI001F0ADC9D|nr:MULTISPECIES: hypothetical protein [Tenacibaculum]MCH3883137.1 hypothetical protein [Tenacibaculum aquimarinum]MDO6600875.1 hypothetical protein [Tenacibaculum sp. 1_MG-2023]